MDSIPKEIRDTLLKVANYVSDKDGVLEEDLQKEVILYKTSECTYTANCAMDSSRAAVKDVCRQIISKILL